jgi:hypothetical protein
VKTQSIDTPPEVEELVVQQLRALGLAGRVEAFLDLQRGVEQLALSGIRARHGESSPEEEAHRLAALRLDRATMIRVYGWDPAVRGY